MIQNEVTSLEACHNDKDFGHSKTEKLQMKIMGVGTATPVFSYSQEEVLDLLGLQNKQARLMFLNSSIKNRYLSLPIENQDGSRVHESQADLLKKHAQQGVKVGAKALKRCLANIGADLSDIKYLCCVTTTGFLTPGLSALLCEKLNLSHACRRVDIVGMGCNAGLNGLNTTLGWTHMNPGELAVMLCVEICSAAYVLDESINACVVNSLFGDGAAAAALVSAYSNFPVSAPRVIKFASSMIPKSLDSMRFDWDDNLGRFNFYLTRDVPYVIGANVEEVITRLLQNSDIRRSDISHWIIHSGGKKVIDSIKVNLDLTAHDLRHTTSVLRDYGNMSSGSFLFSYERLLQEGLVKSGDYGVMMTMGPGATIETALIQW